MTYLQRAEQTLAAIRGEDRYRELPQHGLGNVIDFSSNDYLGLATDPQVVEALKRATRVGSGGARLLGGRSREHALLEDELADWLGRERALLFSSGYLAGVGTIPVLA
ncbi:MAG: aminotransferase class I/II-fold pyridoxal phosphate-dependent enzyme, partial [Candidatus Cybelea sp.]